jgi:xylulose-5-phosphate/fructose-6-phosphate phosphoketolase
VETVTTRYWTTMERHKLSISEHGDDMPGAGTL